MNIFKKYKAKSIAIIVSLFIYGVMFLLLAVIPGLGSSSTIDESKMQEEAIQFQLMEDIAVRSLSATKITGDKKISDKSSPAATKVVESKETPSDGGKDLDEDDSDDATNVVLNNDSVMLEQLKKSLAVLKEVIPEDSLEDNPIAQKNTEKAHQAFADKTQTTAEDWEFIRNNYRAIQNIRRLYPYVLKTKEIINNLNAKLATMTDGRQKRQLIKQTEKELYGQFEKDVRNMSYSQGKLLLKLLARETNQTAYGLIKTYKGGIPATFWYGVGLLFHENLKARYDSLGEDAVLEKIIQKHKLGKF